MTASSRKPRWAPRLWEGCNFPAWAKLLIRNRFAVDPRLLYIPLIVNVVSTANSVLTAFQEMMLRHRIARTRVTQSPIFILGHWRSGTTLLHELLILDPRHSFPTTYQCLEPNHFLLSEEIMSRLLKLLIPGRRPMDNMSAGWDRPQEDEFALCMMGVPSPYLTMAFPNHPPAYPEYLDLRDVSVLDRDRWKSAFHGFLQRVTVKNPRRLVLKSPPHTARIRTLLEMFPDARFVHIVRNPYVVFASTVNLWKTLYRTQGLQVPRYEGLEDYVFETFLRMYDRFTEDRPSIPEGNFHELKYEDLVADPVGQIEQLYERWHFDEFDRVRPRIVEYREQNKNYETNKYELAPEKRAEIARRWGRWIAEWGYEES